MKKTAEFVLAILASLAFLVNPGFGALPRYEITDLGTLGGGYGYAGAIDNAAALAGDSCIIDSVNADEIQVPNAFWSASELGWLYTPGFSYILTGVLTNLGNSHIDGTSPLVTLEVYDGLPVEDANLLRSAQFRPADRSWVGGHFDPLVLTAGEHYFIGFRNVKDLWASHSYDGVPLPIYYGYDNDGTYPFTENGDVEYAMLKFQGTHIHPLRVPADYQTIQAAIDVAVDGDTVLVADGTYTDEGNRDIDFRGKAIIVCSENGPENCIIDCQGLGRGFYFQTNEDRDLVIDGFTIINGRTDKMRYGAGIGSKGMTAPTIRNCVITGCVAQNGGGGIASSGAQVVNCVIFGNYAGWAGGGVWTDHSSMEIINCTIVDNSARDYASGLCHWQGGHTTIINSIFWNKGSSQIRGTLSTVSVSYSDVKGGYGGEGNINANPLLEPDGYHLKSGSPCINAGDPNYVAEPNETDLDGKPRVIGGRIDMGAYEYYPSIPTEIRIVPRTINLASKGKWITCYVWLPEEYNVARIDPNSVLLEGEIKPEEFSVDQQKQVAVLRFSREDVQAILNVGDVELTISGQLTDGT
ncbi:MAG: hypothetical protein HWN51_02210, partial [Desulfobacterales bacterium]|nr:hypothetical protein [Desulfobacterales bacterium]